MTITKIIVFLILFVCEFDYVYLVCCEFKMSTINVMIDNQLRRKNAFYCKDDIYGNIYVKCNRGYKVFILSIPRNIFLYLCIRYYINV